MNIGKFKVTGCYTNDKTKNDVLHVKCGNCNQDRELELRGNKMGILKCYKCGTVIVIVPTIVDRETGKLKEFITVKYSIYQSIHKLCKELKLDTENEIEYMISNITGGNGNGKE